MLRVGKGAYCLMPSPEGQVSTDRAWFDFLSIVSRSQAFRVDKVLYPLFSPGPETVVLV